MRYLTIKQGKCEISGINGWGIKSLFQKFNDDYALSPSENMTLICHDIVEHPSLKHIGSIEDELEALGGAYNTRAKWGDGVTDDGLAGDVSNMFGQSGGKIKRAPRCKSYLAKDVFKHIIKQAKSHAKHEYGYTKQKWKAFKKEALKWMQSGYAKNIKRFGDRFVANNLFNEIKIELETIAQHAEPWEEIILGYSYNGNHVKVTARLRESYY